MPVSLPPEVKAFVLWRSKGKAFCERPFALYRQHIKKDKQHIYLDPP